MGFWNFAADYIVRWTRNGIEEISVNNTFVGDSDVSNLISDLQFLRIDTGDGALFWTDVDLVDRKTNWQRLRTEYCLDTNILPAC